MKIKVLFIILVSALTMTVTSGQKAKKDLKITGTVTDKNQKPIAGATIFVDNKSTTKVTNSKGVYKVKVMSDSKTISVLSSSGKLARITNKWKDRNKFLFAG